MTPVASWRLALPTPPAPKRYETAPLRPASCHALTTATRSAPGGLPSGTKLVTRAPREHRVGHRAVCPANESLGPDSRRDRAGRVRQTRHGWQGCERLDGLPTRRDRTRAAGTSALNECEALGHILRLWRPRGSSGKHTEVHRPHRKPGRGSFPRPRCWPQGCRPGPAT